MLKFIKIYGYDTVKLKRMQEVGFPIWQYGSKMWKLRTV